MLLNSIQTRRFLSHESFTGFKDCGTRERLWLRSVHKTYAKLGDTLRGGEADVWYGIEKDTTSVDPAHDLTIDESVAPVGTQSLSGLADVVKELGTRIVISRGGEGLLHFDMRALAYVCGSTASISAVGHEPKLGASSQPVVMTPSHMLQIGNSFVVTRAMWDNENEFVTLMKLCKMAGLDEVYCASQTVPRSGSVLKGKALGVYANKIYANVLCQACTITAGAAHHEAYWSGTIVGIRVLSHSKEGGGMRKVLRTRSYPVPCGMMTPHIQTKVGLSTTICMSKSDLTRYMIAMALENVGRFTRSDVSGVKGLPTYFERTGADSNRPSTMLAFEDKTYKTLARWRELAISECGLVADDIQDFSSLKKYFKDDKEDKHWAPEYVAPYFWAEPGPISLFMESGIKMLGCQGVGHSLPMVDGAKGYKTHNYQDYEGVPFAGSSVRLVAPGGYRARESGINLLFSGRYSRANGLSQFQQVKSYKLGVFTDSLAMAGDADGSLADRRWHTYHNPTPHPGECFTNLPAAFTYTYSGGVVEPTLEEFVNTKVHSTFGPLMLGTPSEKESKYHRNVPEEVEELMALTHSKQFFLTTMSGAEDLETLVEGEFTPVVQLEPPKKKEARGDSGPRETVEADEHVEEDNEVETAKTETELAPGREELAPKIERESTGRGGA